MQLIRSTAAILGLFILTSAAAFGARLHVPLDFPTIQAAINEAATEGDSVLVGPGTYGERVNFKGKAVVVSGVAGPDSTVIDGRGIEACVVMWSQEGPGAVLDGFTLTRGSFGNGAGLHLNGAEPILRNLHIEDCHASGDGGGIYVLGQVSPQIENCTVRDCSATGAGAGVASFKGDPSFERCLFIANSAPIGGGIWASRGDLRLVNCTFDQNTAETGGHLALQDTTDALFHNSIAVHSTASGLWADETASVTVSYSDVWGNSPDYDGIDPGPGCISEDPLFVPGSHGLSMDSPCIDAGDPNEIPPPGGGVAVDMGALEYIYGVRVITVDPGQSIQVAIDTSLAGDHILVSPGTYYENLDLVGKLVELKSSDGAEETVIDGGAVGSVIWVHQGESAATLISGLTLRNGANTRGGGLLIEGADPTIRDLIVEDCAADADGGGVYIRNWCSPSLSGLIIRNNDSGGFGGGIGMYRADPIIANTLVYGNTSFYGGGGLFIKDSAATIDACTIALNAGGAGTGGIYLNLDAVPSITNSIISHSLLGGGIRVTSNADPYLAYNCCWGNQGDDWANVSPGVGSFSADPLYVDAAGDNFHLSSSAGYLIEDQIQGQTPGPLSPCIDAADPELDVGLEPVPNGERRNLGTYGGTALASRTPGANFTIPGDFGTINEAIAASVSGDTIRLAEQAYHEHVVIDGVAVSLIGAGRDQTFIDGDNARPCLTVRGVNPNTMEIRGITFREGLAAGGVGGGISLVDASPAITDCRIQHCNAAVGGGLHVSLASPQISFLDLCDNHASQNGGAIAFVNGATGKMSRSILHRNSADSLGGAIYTLEASPDIVSCTMDSNYAGLLARGGSIDIDRSSATTVRNCTVSHTSNGHGIYGHPQALAMVIYTNGWDNAPSGDWGGRLYGSEFTRYRYDPRFTKGDPYYALAANSRLIDLGDPSDPAPEGGGQRIDIGAYEYVQRQGHLRKVPQDHATIGEALALSAEGDTIEVSSGTYHERIYMGGIGVHLLTSATDGEVVWTAPANGMGDEESNEPLLWIDGISVPRIVVSGFVFVGGDADRGGALRVDHSAVDVLECVFQGNLATHGGAVAINGGSPLFDSCRFFANEAHDGDGGAIYVEASDEVLFRHCVIAENTTNRDGGGVCLASGRPDFVNVTISRNHAQGLGAGVYMTGGTNALIRNSIITSNTGAEGIYAHSGADAELRRNNVWGNEGQDYVGLPPGGGDMSEDPLFVGGDPFDYHIQSLFGSWHENVGDFVQDAATSPCIDRGINPDNDPLIEPLPNGGLINLGFAGNTPYASFSAQEVWNVPSEIATIQAAIANSISGDLILVEPGTYSGSIDFEGKDIALVARGGPDSTALIGSLGIPIVSFHQRETQLASLDGFTLANNMAEMGAAVYIETSSPTIINCRFEGNMATIDGGGALAVVLGGARIIHNEFRDNWAPLEGGAIFLNDAATLVEDNLFENNHSEFAGGALAIVGDLPTHPPQSPSVVANEFRANTCGGSGGGAVYLQQTAAVLRGNEFLENRTPYHGGALYAYGDDNQATVISNLFAHNEAWDVDQNSRGGAIAVRYGSRNELAIVNNTLVDNLAAQGSGVLVQSSDAALINNIIAGGRSGAGVEGIQAEPLTSYNDFWNNEGGPVHGFDLHESNLEADPGFADTSYSLLPSSAMIDVGYDGAFYDRDGSVPDLGAYPITHKLDLFALPDSTSIPRESWFGVQIDVVNPDLQVQSPIVRETTVIPPVGSKAIVIDRETLTIAPGETVSERVEAWVQRGVPLGDYQVRVTVSVRDVVYDEEIFMVEIQ